MSRPLRRTPRNSRGGRASGKRAGSRRGAARSAEELLDLAVRAVEGGSYRRALELAGEAVRLDPACPEGYLIIGDAHLFEGETGEAEVAYGKALEKSRRGEFRSDLETDGELPALRAAAGLSRCALVRGDYAGAKEVLVSQIELDPADPLGAALLLAEVHLVLGEFQDAANVLAARPLDMPDQHLALGFARYHCGERGPATESFRMAMLQNPYLVAALLGEDPPDYGIVHGTEQGGPGFARDVATRLAPYLDGSEDALEFLADVATSEIVIGEIRALLDAARALNSVRDPRERERLAMRIGHLRNPARIAAGTADVLRDLPG